MPTSLAKLEVKARMPGPGRMPRAAKPLSFQVPSPVAGRGRKLSALGDYNKKPAPAEEPNDKPVPAISRRSRDSRGWRILAINYISYGRLQRRSAFFGSGAVLELAGANGLGSFQGNQESLPRHD